MIKSMTGVVSGVTGETFVLVDEAQRRHTFALALDISLEAGDLRELQREGTRVTVDYDDDTPASHVAHRVFVPPSPATRH
ncbi:MAG TPA: hypothetical protein VFJ62_01100 [Usitatibacter sp.]|nr:hypothetical protein [Usitatibacter sp.]